MSYDERDAPTTNILNNTVARVLVFIGIAIMVALFCRSQMGLGSPRSPITRPRATTQPATIQIRYILEGRGRASVTMRNDTGGSEQFDVTLPWDKTLNGMELGDSTYISAQVISQNGGNVTCEITSRGTVIATAAARGFAKIATCSGLAE